MKKGLLLTLLVLSIALASFGQFTEAINFSNSPGIPSHWPDVCFGPDGVVHVVWAENYTSSTSDILYSNYDGTTWAAPIAVTPDRNGVRTFPFIACNNKGTMAVVWESNRGETWLREYDGTAKVWKTAMMLDPAVYGFLDKPKVVLDEEDNIYTFYFTRGTGLAHSKCRINGVWEPRFLLNEPGLRIKEGGIAIAPDGKIWVVYSVKHSGGDYKIYYRSRTKSTQWSASNRGILGGNSQEQPYVAIGPDNIPRVCYIGNAGTEGANAVNYLVIDGDKNPTQNALTASIYHLPRIAVDNENYSHIAVEWGQGDHGLAIRMANNVGGHWNPYVTMPMSGGGPKLPGISAEAYGNIAVVWDSMLDGSFEAWFASRYPVVVKHFYAPVNLSATITIDNMKSAPTIKYVLNWEKNPANNDQFIKGYKIYKKTGSGEFQLFLEPAKTVFSVELGNLSASEKYQFAISTVSLTGLEGDKVTF